MAAERVGAAVVGEQAHERRLQRLGVESGEATRVQSGDASARAGVVEAVVADRYHGLVDALDMRARPVGGEEDVPGVGEQQVERTVACQVELADERDRVAERGLGRCVDDEVSAGALARRRAQSRVGHGDDEPRLQVDREPAPARRRIAAAEHGGLGYEQGGRLPWAVEALVAVGAQPQHARAPYDNQQAHRQARPARTSS